MSTSEREALRASAAAARTEAAPEAAQSAPEAVDPQEGSDRSDRNEYVPMLETARILVVDDEKVIREILADFLTMEGYVVHAVEDGKAKQRPVTIAAHKHQHLVFEW